VSGANPPSDQGQREKPHRMSLKQCAHSAVYNDFTPLAQSAVIITYMQTARSLALIIQIRDGVQKIDSFPSISARTERCFVYLDQPVTHAQQSPPRLFCYTLFVCTAASEFFPHFPMKGLFFN
jgi:hypothetical protein